MTMSICNNRWSSTRGAARRRRVPALSLSLSLLLVALAGPSSAAGADDGVDISGAIARDVLIDQLQSRNLDIPAGSDLTLRDYIYNNAGQARTHASVGVWLDADGHMVPSPDWQKRHKDYCKSSGNSPRKATQLLAFKMTRERQKADGKARSQYWVFAQLSDINSGKIREQHEGQSSVMQADNRRSGVGNNPDAEGLPPAMDAAWDGLSVNVGAPLSPCQDKEEEKTTGAIQPRDGTWAIKLTSHHLEGCSPKIAGGVKKAMANLGGKKNQHDLTFAKPFHPEPLMQHQAGLTWTQTGVNTWKTEIAGTKSSAMSMRVVLQAEVVSPTRIEEVGTHYIDISPTLVKIMGGTAHCRAIGNYEVTWLR